jgi:dsRNA-specific ribonuclease
MLITCMVIPKPWAFQNVKLCTDSIASPSQPHALQDMHAGFHRTPEEIGDRFEALLGAMYEDHGLDFTSSWFERRLRCVVTLSGLTSVNAGSTQALLSYCSINYLKSPEYVEHSSRSYPDPCSPWPIRTHVYSISIGKKHKVWPSKSMSALEANAQQLHQATSFN